MKKKKDSAKRTYTEPAMRLIELEFAAPILGTSVDELEGTTDPSNPPTGGISLEDFDDGGSITIP